MLIIDYCKLSILLLFFWLAVDSAVGDSPTFDEQNHIARGVSFLETGDPRLSLEHPPLINVWSALPLVGMGLDVPVETEAWQQSQWYLFAEQLLWERNADHVEAIVFSSRIPIILLTMTLGAICFHWARRWWGTWAGVVVMGLLLFDPNIMAHGRLSTTDLGGTLMIVCATYLLWKMAVDGRWHTILLAGIGMGLAFGSKLSALGFVFIWFGGVVWVWFARRHESEKGLVKTVLEYGAAGLTSIIVVWAIFGFEWGNGVFLGERWAWLNQQSIPMPTFWGGIERIAGATGGGRPAFLWGNYATDGFWNYFLIAFLVKTPLIVIGAVGYVIFDLTQRHEGAKGKRGFLVAIAAGYFLLTFTSSLNIGYRHLLPMLPFLYLLIGGLMGRGVVGRSIAVGTLVCSMALTIWGHPHHISYFNQIAGGSENGWQVLIDSNIDWGQDLYRLRDWMAENEVESVKLAWFGASQAPAHFITYEPLPGKGGDFEGLWFNVPFDVNAPQSGVYAITVHNLQEMQRRFYGAEPTVYAWFRGREPDVRIGHSIHIHIVE